MQRIGTKRIESIRYGTPTKRIIARSLLFSPALRAAAKPLPAGRWPIWNTTDGDACFAPLAAPGVKRHPARVAFGLPRMSACNDYHGQQPFIYGNLRGALCSAMQHARRDLEAVDASSQKQTAVVAHQPRFNDGEDSVDKLNSKGKTT